MALSQARQQGPGQLPPLLVQAQAGLACKGLGCRRDCPSCRKHIPNLHASKGWITGASGASTAVVSETLRGCTSGCHQPWGGICKQPSGSHGSKGMQKDKARSVACKHMQDMTRGHTSALSSAALRERPAAL